MKTWRSKAITLGLACLATFAGAQPAARASVALNIEALPVGDALNELARQTGLQVVLFAEVSKGITTPKLTGTFTPDAALEKLLAGTGLRYEYLNDRTLAVRAIEKERGKGKRAADGPAFERLRFAQTGSPGAEATEEASGKSPSQAEAAADAGSKFALEEIVVEGKRYGVEQTTVGRIAVPYIDVPQSASVVTSEFLNDAKLLNINDAVLFVPGVEVLDASGGYVVRGISAAVLEDGINISSAAIVDSFFYDRFEIAKGPASAAFGRGSPGGYVNRVSKKPRFREGTEASFLFGTANDRKNTYRTTLDQEGFLSQDHQTAYRFTALWDDGAQSMNIAGEYRRQGAQLAVTRKLEDDRGQLDVVGSYQQASINGFGYQGQFSDKYGYGFMKYLYKSLFGATLPDHIDLIDGNDAPGLNWAVKTENLFQLHGTLDYKVSDHWHGRLAGAYVNTQIDGDIPFHFYILSVNTFPTADGKDVQTTPGVFSADSISNQKSVQVDLLGDYAIAPIGAKLQLLTGADYDRLDTVDGTARGISYAAGPVPLHAWNPDIKIPAYSVRPLEVGARGAQDNWSVYAQGQMGFLQDRVRLSAAVRRTWLDSTYLFQNSGDVLSTKTHSPLLPQYSLLLKPRDWLSFYVTHSEQLEPPVLTFRYQTAGIPTIDVPADDPIRTEQFVSQATTKLNEIGIKANLFDNRLTFSLAHFQSKSQGGVLAVPTAYTTPDGREIGLLRFDASHEDIEGWEIEGFGQLGWRLTYALGAALGTKGEKTGVLNGSLITGSSTSLHDSAFAYATYHFGENRDHGLSVTAGAKVIFSGWTMGGFVVLPKVPEVAYPKDQYVVDLGANYAFSDKIEVFLKGNNILHQAPVPYGYGYNIPGRLLFAGITVRL